MWRNCSARDPGCEALVVATGPSLAGHYDRLQQVMAQAATAAAHLRRHGLPAVARTSIRPDFIVSTDINIQGSVLQPQQSESIRLVYFPMVDPEVLAAWQGVRYGAYSASPQYDEVRALLPRGEPFANGSVLASGGRSGGQDGRGTGDPAGSRFCLHRRADPRWLACRSIDAGAHVSALGLEWARGARHHLAEFSQLSVLSGALHSCASRGAVFQYQPGWRSRSTAPPTIPSCWREASS